MTSPVLQFKRGASANVGIASFKAGEPGFTTDKYDFYIGLDGTAANQKFFGSSRYWTRETGSTAALLKLVDKNGSNSINLKSPDTLSGIATYTFPATPVANNFLTVDAAGVMSWSSISTNASFTNATLTGVTTIGSSGGDTLNIAANTNVTGIATFTQSITGTISTATRATRIDTITAPANTYYPGLFVNNTGTSSTSVYVDSGISYAQSTNTLTLTGNLNVNGGTVATTSGVATVFNVNATTVNAFGAATSLNVGANSGTLTIGNPTVVGTQASQNLYNTVATSLNFGGAATSLVMGASSGIATINNTTLTLPNATTVNVNGASPTFASSSTGTLTFFNTNLATVNAFGAATNIVLGNTTGVTTVRNSLRVTNALYDSNNSAGTSGQLLASTQTGIGWTSVISATLTGTISTATRATTADVTATNAQTAGLVFATAGNGATLYNDTDLTYNSNTNVLTVPNLTASTQVNTPAIKAADGTSSITIANSTGSVGIASDLTVSGSLYVAGNTTQVNTTSLQVEDRVIELGKIATNATAPSDTTWDLGILFNYYTASANKKASVYWEGGVSRFLFASDVTESVLGINLPDSGAVGLGTTTPQLTSPTYAPIEVGELWVNNSCVSNTSTRIIGCTGGVLVLTDVTIDAGQF